MHARHILWALNARVPVQESGETGAATATESFAAGERVRSTMASGWEENAVDEGSPNLLRGIGMKAPGAVGCFMGKAPSSMLTVGRQ